MKRDVQPSDDRVDDASLYCPVKRVKRGFVSRDAALAISPFVLYGYVLRPKF